jgi:integrase/recombinase XerC
MPEYIFKPSHREKGKRILSRFWHGRFSVGRGPVRSVSLKVTDKAAARAKLRQIVVEAEREAAGIVAPRPVRDAAAASLVTLLAEYRADMRGRELSASHIKESTRRIERIIQGTGWCRLCDVTPATFTAWRGGLTCSAKTKHEYQTSLKAFLNWLVRGSRLLVNPLAKVDAVKRQGKQVRLSRAFTAGEFTALLGIAPLYRRIVYQFLAYTGFRKKETRTLKRAALDLDGGTVRVTGKGGKTRVVPLHADLVSALRAWLAVPVRDALLFPRFPSDDALHADFKRAGIARKDTLGRVVHWHAFRKTFTTWAASAGVGLRSAQAILGHSTPNLTANIYTDVEALPLRREVQKMPWIAAGGQDLRSVKAASSFALNPSLSSACNAAILRFRELLAEMVAVGNVALSEGFAKVGASGNWLPDMDLNLLCSEREVFGYGALSVKGKRQLALLDALGRRALVILLRVSEFLAGGPNLAGGPKGGITMAGRAGAGHSSLSLPEMCSSGLSVRPVGPLRQVGGANPEPGEARPGGRAAARSAWSGRGTPKGGARRGGGRGASEGGFTMPKSEEPEMAFAAKYPVFMEAVARGERELFEWQQLLEVGTDEQILEEEMRRAAMVRANDFVCEIRWQLWRESAAGQEFYRNRALARAAEQGARAGRSYAQN